jgi:hypothetical protein
MTLQTSKVLRCCMISRRVEGDVVEAKTQGEENEIIINHLGVQGNGCQGEMRNLVEYELTDFGWMRTRIDWNMRMP